MRKILSKNGFTLIELMIVVSLISLLITAGVVAYTKIMANSRNAKRQADLESVKSSLVLYRTDVGSYPASVSFTDMSPIASYISVKSMKGPQGDSYTYTAGGCVSGACKTFSVCTNLENTSPSSYCVTNP